MKTINTCLVAGGLLFAAASVGQTQSPQQEFTLNVHNRARQGWCKSTDIRTLICKHWDESFHHDGSCH